MVFGVLYLATFVFSIAGVLLYDPVLHPVKFMVGTGGDTRVRLGAVCEVFLIIANIGTAVVIYPIFRRRFEVLSIGYVTARLVECTFIAIGIVSYLAVVTLHPKPARPPAPWSTMRERSSRYATGRSSSVPASSPASATG